jgi:DNA-binding transcriptional regulator YhcF (GntR family)
VFVAEPRAQLAKDVRRRRLIELIDKFLTEAVHLGFSEADVMRLLSARSEQFQWEPARLETR